MQAQGERLLATSQCNQLIKLSCRFLEVTGATIAIKNGGHTIAKMSPVLMSTKSPACRSAAQPFDMNEREVNLIAVFLVTTGSVYPITISSRNKVEKNSAASEVICILDLKKFCIQNNLKVIVF